MATILEEWYFWLPLLAGGAWFLFSWRARRPLPYESASAEGQPRVAPREELFGNAAGPQLLLFGAALVLLLVGAALLLRHLGLLSLDFDAGLLWFIGFLDLTVLLAAATVMGGTPTRPVWPLRLLHGFATMRSPSAYDPISNLFRRAIEGQKRFSYREQLLASWVIWFFTLFVCVLIVHWARGDR